MLITIMEDAMVFILLLLCHLIDHYWQDSISLLHSFILWELTIMDGVITPIWRHACINFITSFLLIVGADYLMLDGVITPIWRRTCMHCYGICACHDTYLTRVFTF